MPTSHKPTPAKILRSQTRRNLDKGAVTAGYIVDRPKRMRMLNKALATEIVMYCATESRCSTGQCAIPSRSCLCGR